MYLGTARSPIIILEKCSLPNADSGCLGLDYRRRTRKAAISAGELPRSFDPAMSEWGNLVVFIDDNSYSKCPDLSGLLKYDVDTL